MINLRIGAQFNQIASILKTCVDIFLVSFIPR